MAILFSEVYQLRCNSHSVPRGKLKGDGTMVTIDCESMCHLSFWAVLCAFEYS